MYRVGGEAEALVHRYWVVTVIENWTSREVKACLGLIFPRG